MTVRNPAEISHMILLAVLMRNGGSMDLPKEAFEPDALRGQDGSWHAIGMELQPDGTYRVSVRPRPDGDDGGVTYQ